MSTFPRIVWNKKKRVKGGGAFFRGGGKKEGPKRGDWQKVFSS